jgi:hypothetical protein
MSPRRTGHFSAGAVDPAGFVTLLLQQALVHHATLIQAGVQSHVSGEYRGRMSTSESVSMGLGHFFSHSTASSMDLTSHSQKPATNSFVSGNGPSITVRFSPEK